jgi:hypothetical protein
MPELVLNAEANAVPSDVAAAAKDNEEAEGRGGGSMVEEGQWAEEEDRGGNGEESGGRERKRNGSWQRTVRGLGYNSKCGQAQAAKLRFMTHIG